MPTQGRGFYELTQGQAWVDENKFKNGLLTLHYAALLRLIAHPGESPTRTCGASVEAFFQRLACGEPLHPREATTMPAHLALTAVI